MSLAVAETLVGRMALRRPAAAAFFVAAFAFVLVDALDGKPLYGDADDLVRLLQIRDLIHDWRFWDLTLPFISMPEAYVSHYSRIVDLPYFLVAEALSPFMGGEGGLAVATWIVPLALLAIFCRLALSVLTRVAGGRFGAVEALVTVLAMSPALLEFTPTRIDHHNVQIVLMMAMLAGLVGPARRGGLAAGVAIALSVAVGLECLPYIVAGLAALALAGVFGGAPERERMQATGLALAVASAPTAILGYGPPIVVATNCDTVSLPWLAALCGGGLVLFAVPLLWRTPLLAGTGGRSAALRFASLAVPGLMLAGGLAAAFPDCALGNFYGMVDPLSKRLWLDTLRQEHGLLYQFADGNFLLAIYGVLWGFLVIATGPVALQSWRGGRCGPGVAWLVALSALVAYLAIERTTRTDAALIGMLVPATIGLLRGEPLLGDGKPVSRRWMCGALAAPLAITLIAYATVPKRPEAATVLEQLHSDECPGADAGVLDDVPPSRIIAPLGISVRIMRDYPQHSVAAVMLHRAAPGMHRMFVALTTRDAAERAVALAPFDYFAVCARDLGLPGLDEFPLFSALLHGDAVPGLDQVEPQRGSAFKLYRIDHAALR